MGVSRGFGGSGEKALTGERAAHGAWEPLSGVLTVSAVVLAVSACGQGCGWARRGRLRVSGSTPASRVHVRGRCGPDPAAPRCDARPVRAGAPATPGRKRRRLTPDGADERAGRGAAHRPFPGFRGCPAPSLPLDA